MDRSKFQVLHRAWRRAFGVMHVMPSEAQVDAWADKYQANDEQKAWMVDLCACRGTVAARRGRPKDERIADDANYAENARLADRINVLTFKAPQPAAAD